MNSDAMRNAIVEDYLENFDEADNRKALIGEYIVIADITDEDGSTAPQIFSSNKEWANELKMIEYARQRILYRMHQQWKRGDGE